MTQHTPRCPVCGGDLARRPIHRRGPWEVRACGSCGHGVTLPQPGPAELAGLYGEEAYYAERDMAPAGLRPEDRARAEALRSTFGGRTLLDVGTGPGALLAAAREIGYEVTGTDLSPTSARIARERFDVAVRVGPFAAEQFGAGERFDLITMIHVLEHVPDPLASLRLAADLLSDAGHLFVELPNRRSLARIVSRAEAERIFDLPAHLHHFTLPSLAEALRRAGLVPLWLVPSIPGPLDRLLARAARARHALAGGRPRPEDGPEPTPRPVRAPAAPPAGRPGVRLLRRVAPGHKIVAVGRRASAP